MERKKRKKEEKRKEWLDRRGVLKLIQSMPMAVVAVAIQKKLLRTCFVECCFTSTETLGLLGTGEDVNEPSTSSG